MKNPICCLIRRAASYAALISSLVFYSLCYAEREDLKFEFTGHITMSEGRHGSRLVPDDNAKLEKLKRSFPNDHLEKGILTRDDLEGKTGWFKGVVHYHNAYANIYEFILDEQSSADFVKNNGNKKRRQKMSGKRVVSLRGMTLQESDGLYFYPISEEAAAYLGHHRLLVNPQVSTYPNGRTEIPFPAADYRISGTVDGDIITPNPTNKPYSIIYESKVEHHSKKPEHGDRVTIVGVITEVPWGQFQKRPSSKSRHFQDGTKKSAGLTYGDGSMDSYGAFGGTYMILASSFHNPRVSLPEIEEVGGLGYILQLEENSQAEEVVMMYEQIQPFSIDNPEPGALVKVIGKVVGDNGLVVSSIIPVSTDSCGNLF